MSYELRAEPLTEVDLQIMFKFSFRGLCRTSYEDMQADAQVMSRWQSDRSMWLSPAESVRLEERRQARVCNRYLP